MRAFLFLLLLFIANLNLVAQVVWGANMGMVLSTKTSSPQLTTRTNGIILWSRVNDGFDFFLGVYLETDLLKKIRVKQELAIYKSSHIYHLLVPDNDPNSNFLYFEPVTSILFTTLNYRALIRLVKKRNVSVRAGPSIDFDFVRVPYDAPYYAPSYPEAIELEKSLENSFNFATLYADIELGYNWKRLDLAINYKRSITSQTGRFVYDGNPHNLKSVTTQFFIRIGYQFIVKNKDSK